MIPQTVIGEFERMKWTTELKVLSAISLERPLDDKEHYRMVDLSEKVGLYVR